MNEVFHDIDCVKNKRRNTYKKRLAEEEEPSSSLAPLLPVLGDGFLFQSKTIDRVRNRLKNSEKESTQVISQTQTLSNLYDNGEELEERKLMDEPHVSKPDSIEETQKDYVISEAVLDVGLVFTRDSLSAKEGGTIAAPDAFPATQSLKTLHEQSATQHDFEPSAEDARTQYMPSLNVGTHSSQTQLISNLSTGARPSITRSVSVLPYSEDNGTELMGFKEAVDKNNQPSTLKIHDIQNDISMKNEVNHSHCMQHKRKNDPRGRIVFSRESFVRNFDEHSESESNVSDQESKLADEGENTHLTADTDELYLSKKQEHHSGALSAYRRELVVKAGSKDFITLSSESDEEDDMVDPPASCESKATVLEIRARLSRRKPPIEPQRGKASLNDLIGSLKKSTKKQIMEHQKEMIERQGLKMEDIEKEKELVENLLEQEIARNKRIRLKEKEKAKSARAITDNTVSDEGGEYAESEYSDSATSFLSKAHSDSLMRQEDGDENSIQQSVESETESLLTESDDETLRVKKLGKHTVPILANSVSDDEAENVRNAINLGSYGTNLCARSPAKQKSAQDGLGMHSTGEDREWADRDLFQKKIRALEASRKTRMREMKISGVTDMFEVEAEESDDEWQGVGGIDGDVSDEYDSELERMIDDSSNATSNANQVRRLLAAESKEMDLKTVNKILYDIKNGVLRKRRRNGLNLELSDDEDYELKNYRTKRREIMRKKRLQLDENNKRLLKNTRSQAFFESMVEDILDGKNAFGSDDIKPHTEQEQERAKLDNAGKKKLTISEEFVQHTLSFLNSNRERSEFDVSQDLTQEDECKGIDLLTLKQRSFIKSLQSPSVGEPESSCGLDEDDDYKLPSLNSYVSVIKSFDSKSNPDDKLKNGKKTVTVSKSYRSAGCNKASITYLGKMRKLVAPKPIHSSKNSAITGLHPFAKNKIFQKQEGNFEPDL